MTAKKMRERDEALSRAADEALWTIREHRFDVGYNRYRTREVEKAGPIVVCADPDNHKSCGVTHAKDSSQGVYVLRLRNTEIHSVDIDPIANTIDIYLGNRAPRPWRKVAKLRKPDPRAERCLCQHPEIQHDDNGCMVPACGCDIWFPMKKGEALAAALSRYYHQYPERIPDAQPVDEQVEKLDKISKTKSKSK